MSDSVYERVLDFVRQHPVPFIDLTGWGEPLTDPQLEFRIQQLKSILPDVYVGFTSNGTLFTEDRIARVLSSGVDQIDISFDAGTQPTYERIRRPSRFEPTLYGLSLLSSLRDRDRVILGADFVILPENRAEMEDFIRLFKGIGFDSVTFRPLQFRADTETQDDDPAQAQRLYEQFLALRAKYSGEISVHEFHLSPRLTPNDCLAAAAAPTLFVNAAGDVSPCCILGHRLPSTPSDPTQPTFSFGNVLTQSIEDIIRSPTFRNFINSFKQSLLPHPCAGCTLAGPDPRAGVQRIDQRLAIDQVNLLDHPICLTYPKRACRPNWLGHIPFAMLLVDLCRPSTIVELGAYHGDSYCAFCQAVAGLHLPTRCFAVDTWRGDIHTGEYGSEVLANLRLHHDAFYAGFSTLLQCAFDEARDFFKDQSISILHIDGCHTYEGVKHDFETWRPKLKPDAIVLFHDTCERREDFGVHRFWHELTSQYPHFEFLHASGLGVLSISNPPAPALSFLFDADEVSARLFRRFFSCLGDRISAAKDPVTRPGADPQELSDTQQALGQLQQALEETQEALATSQRELKRLQRLPLVRANSLLARAFDTLKRDAFGPVSAGLRRRLTSHRANRSR